MIKYSLILGVSVILMLTTQGVMAMDVLLGLFAPSESKETGFSTVVAGSSNNSKYADEKNDHKEVTGLNGERAIRAQQKISLPSELDDPETSLCIRYPKMSILIPWNFTAIHDGLIFEINGDSQHIRALKSSGEFKTHCYNNAQFISLPTVDGKLLIRYNTTSVQTITSDDIEVFQQCATRQSIKALVIPFVDLTKARQSFKMTNEGIIIVVPQTKPMPTFTTIEDDSKSYCRTEGVTLSINSPFSFVLLTENNNDNYRILEGNVDKFSVLEIYKGG